MQQLSRQTVPISRCCVLFCFIYTCLLIQHLLASSWIKRNLTGTLKSTHGITWHSNDATTFSFHCWRRWWHPSRWHSTTDLPGFARWWAMTGTYSHPHWQYSGFICIYDLYIRNIYWFAWLVGFLYGATLNIPTTCCLEPQSSIETWDGQIRKLCPLILQPVNRLEEWHANYSPETNMFSKKNAGAGRLFSFWNAPLQGYMWIFGRVLFVQVKCQVASNCGKQKIKNRWRVNQGHERRKPSCATNRTKKQSSVFGIHSEKLTWPLKMCPPTWKVVFQPSIFRCHVSFREGKIQWTC